MSYDGNEPGQYSPSPHSGIDKIALSGFAEINPDGDQRLIRPVVALDYGGTTYAMVGGIQYDNHLRPEVEPHMNVAQRLGHNIGIGEEELSDITDPSSSNCKVRGATLHVLPFNYPNLKAGKATIHQGTDIGGYGGYGSIRKADLEDYVGTLEEKGLTVEYTRH